MASTFLTMGGITTSTDKYGYFEIKNVQVLKEVAVVTVTKPGFFNAIKTYIASDGRSAFLRIKIMNKSNAGNVNAATGGSIKLANGLMVSLGANVLVDAATNDAYSGQVTISAKWIDPTAKEINRIMPGDLRGLDSTGGTKLLTTYGMAAVELRGAAGNFYKLQWVKKLHLPYRYPPV